MLADIHGARSSVHINQFGFRPGLVGESFAAALIVKAAAGVRVRLVVDKQGSDPEGASIGLYRRLVAAGVEVCVVRATKPRVASFGPLGNGGEPRWNLGALGHIDHRKLLVVDGRIGWVGGAGIEDHFHDGRFHDLIVRVERPVVAQLQLVSSRASAGSAARSRPRSSTTSCRRSTRGRRRLRRSCFRPRPAATDRSPTRSRVCWTMRARHSTS